MQTMSRTTPLFAAMIAAGCGQLPNANSTADDIRTTVTDSGAAGVATTWSGDGAPSIPEAGVAAFGRQYTTVSVSYDVEQPDAFAEAFIERMGSGELVVDYHDGGPLRKTIDSDRASRFVTLEQTDTGDWEIQQVSVYQGTSADGSTAIEHVTVSWGDNEVTFAQADALYDWDVLTFWPGQEVTVRVMVNDPAAIGLLHQLSENVDFIEQKMLEPGDAAGELVNVYFAPEEPGDYFTYVDVFDEASVIEADAPYSAAAWGMPFVVSQWGPAGP